MGSKHLAGGVNKPKQGIEPNRCRDSSRMLKKRPVRDGFITLFAATGERDPSVATKERLSLGPVAAPSRHNWLNRLGY